MSVRLLAFATIARRKKWNVVYDLLAELASTPEKSISDGFDLRKKV